MNENDLRVKKTREAIETAFLKLMKEKPIEKITVTELATHARINKGTFYLHYHDIYDLHNRMMNKFFDELMASIDYFQLFIERPEQFLQRFEETIQENFDFFCLLLQKNSETLYQQILVEKLCKKIRQACALADDAETHIQLDAVLNLLLYVMPKYNSSNPNITQSLVCKIIRMFWKNA